MLAHGVADVLVIRGCAYSAPIGGNEGLPPPTKGLNVWAKDITDRMCGNIDPPRGYPKHGSDLTRSDPTVPTFAEDANSVHMRCSRIGRKPELDHLTRVRTNDPLVTDGGVFINTSSTRWLCQA